MLVIIWGIQTFVVLIYYLFLVSLTNPNQVLSPESPSVVLFNNINNFMQVYIDPIRRINIVILIGLAITRSIVKKKNAKLNADEKLAE